MKEETKPYQGKLNIGRESVSIHTNNVWQGIEIKFSGKMRIESMLSNNYIVKAGENKVIIVKLNNTLEVVKDLFKYKGNSGITKCKIITPELESIKLQINEHSLQLWNTLQKYTLEGSDTIEQDWAYLGENWEDIDFDGNNDKHYYTYRKTIYDKEADTYTEIKELRNK